MRATVCIFGHRRTNTTSAKLIGAGVNVLRSFGAAVVLVAFDFLQAECVKDVATRVSVSVASLARGRLAQIVEASRVYGTYVQYVRTHCDNKKQPAWNAHAGTLRTVDTGPSADGLDDTACVQQATH